MKTREGLARKDAELQCLPTFVADNSLIQDGLSYIIDLGGSNVRAGIVSVTNGAATVIRQSESIAMPWKRDTPFEKTLFLKIQADLLDSIAVDEKLPLGYCFSYPTESQPDGDAVLKFWTKGIDVPGTVGERVGSLLLKYIQRHYTRLRCGGVTVINDTIAALLAGSDKNCPMRIGLIVGTGFNMAATFDLTHITKIGNDASALDKMPVNLEAGRFLLPFTTIWDDDAVTAETGAGSSIIEKAVSGAYLGRLLKKVRPDCPLDPERGALNLVMTLNQSEGDLNEYKKEALAIYSRSARLVGACLAGLWMCLRYFSQHSIANPPELLIAAEGSLFWSEVDSKKLFHDIALETVEKLIREVGVSESQVRFEKVDNANFIGSAFAALAGSD